ncbi:hypothetical protein DENSPDRAFT_846505 [Dentipellis sp. KUC8613]|nr:hypothetical protein DENSPDRAFT_846505 [Dentipellis sp. KUC8613]
MFFQSNIFKITRPGIPLPPAVLREAFFDIDSRTGKPKPRVFSMADIDQINKIKEASLGRFLLLACARWRQEYRGTALETFATAMRWYEENYNANVHYGRIIAIIQSSGSGKSRLVNELSLNFLHQEKLGSFAAASFSSLPATGPLSNFMTLLGDTAFGFKETKLAAELLSFCQNKWINFTHFVKIEKEIIDLTLDDLEHVWFFGAAIQCCRSQAVIDGGIVCHDGPLEGPFDRQHLGFLPYQTTARSSNAPSKVGLGLTAPPILHPEQHGSKLQRVKSQTIVLLMDFKSTSVFRENSQMTRLELRGAETNVQWKGYADPALGEKEPKNFFINIRGCSAS